MLQKAAYRKLYLQPGEGRRPTLTWPRQIPIDGRPSDVAAVLEANCDWLQETNIPKLFFRANPGMMVTRDVLEFCQSLPNQKEITVTGAHYGRKTRQMRLVILSPSGFDLAVIEDFSAKLFRAGGTGGAYAFPISLCIQ